MDQAVMTDGQVQTQPEVISLNIEDLGVETLEERLEFANATPMVCLIDTCVVDACGANGCIINL
jgi:hypothetical protein